MCRCFRNESCLCFTNNSSFCSSQELQELQKIPHSVLYKKFSLRGLQELLLRLFDYISRCTFTRFCSSRCLLFIIKKLFVLHHLLLCIRYLFFLKKIWFLQLLQESLCNCCNYTNTILNVVIWLQTKKWITSKSFFFFVDIIVHFSQR